MVPEGAFFILRALRPEDENRCLAPVTSFAEPDPAGNRKAAMCPVSGLHATSGIADVLCRHIGNALSLGAAAVYHYRRVDFESEVVEATASRGVDLIIDFVGGSYLARNIRSFAPGGRLIQVGLLGRDDNAIIPLGVVLHNHLRLIGTVMKSRSRAEKRAMVRLFPDQVLPIMGQVLKPIVGAIYPLAAASEAHHRMEAGGLFGKIILTDFPE